EVEIAARQEDECHLLLARHPLQRERPLLIAARLRELDQFVAIARRTGEADMDRVLVDRRAAVDDKLRGARLAEVHAAELERHIVADTLDRAAGNRERIAVDLIAGRRVIHREGAVRLLEREALNMNLRLR